MNLLSYLSSHKLLAGCLQDSLATVMAGLTGNNVLCLKKKGKRLSQNFDQRELNLMFKMNLLSHLTSYKPSKLSATGSSTVLTELVGNNLLYFVKKKTKTKTKNYF